MAAGFIIVALVTAIILVALALSQEPPSWWPRVDASDPATIETAQRVENGITSALTQVRAEPGAASVAAGAGAGAGGAQPAAWKVFITTDQANAWLSVRLRRWLEDQAEQGAQEFRWPSEVSQVRVSFDSGRIRVGAQVTQPGRSSRPQALAATLRPEFRSDGSLWLIAERIGIGRLSLPASWIIGSTGRRVGEVSDELARMPQTERVLAAFKGERPVLSRPIIRLADGRRVRILAVEPVDGRINITCQTEPARAR